MKIELRQSIRAKRERVFQAWTDSKVLQKWICPSHVRCGGAEVEAHVGGMFRISMIGDEEKNTAAGVYEEIVPNRRLVFTHFWEGPGVVETLVTVEFADEGEGTAMSFAQERFEDRESAEMHAEGWNQSFSNLARLLEA